MQWKSIVILWVRGDRQCGDQPNAQVCSHVLFLAFIVRNTWSPPIRECVLVESQLQCNCRHVKLGSIFGISSVDTSVCKPNPIRVDELQLSFMKSGYIRHNSKLDGNFHPAYMNFVQLFLRIHGFICNQLRVFHNHWCRRMDIYSCFWASRSVGIWVAVWHAWI